MSSQASLVSRKTKTQKALSLAAAREYDRVIGLASGGTDSLCAIDAYHRHHEDHDLPPIDLVVQTNTGTTLPSTLDTAREFCAERQLPYIEVLNQHEPAEDSDNYRMLGPRVVRHGWPSNSQGGPNSGGHWVEFINRKQDTWDTVYGSFAGELLCISGGRVAESDRRAMNLGDGAVDFGETGDRHPRKTWLAPCHGWLDAEKARYVDAHDIPVAPAYDFLGYSGDCVACSFDDPRVLNQVRLRCPELAWGLSTLVVWVYARIRRGELDQPIERCVWGTELREDEGGHIKDDGETCQRDLRYAGCSEPSCKASKARADGGSATSPGAETDTRDGGERGGEG